jgi:threonine dehydratase
MALTLPPLKHSRETPLALADIHAARQRLFHSSTDTGVERTALVPSPALSRRFDAEILLKLETRQPTGAFKLRGASHLLAAVAEQSSGDAVTRLARGVTTASTGNHGRALAYAAMRRGLKAIICLSEQVPANKVRAIEALGELGGASGGSVEVRRVGRSQDEAFREVHRLVEEEGMLAVPPFDDPLIAAGQGTIGLELLEDCPSLDHVLIGLSGGGLLGGIGAALKAIRPETQVHGVSLTEGAAMWHSLQAGAPVEVEEVASLADSLGGGIGLDNHTTLPLVHRVMDHHHQVSERAIARAMLMLLEEEKLLVEGAAVVGLAALEASRRGETDPALAESIRGQRVALIISGNGVSLETLDQARALLADAQGQGQNA